MKFRSKSKSKQNTEHGKRKKMERGEFHEIP
jgi:hypothetical protein